MQRIDLSMQADGRAFGAQTFWLLLGRLPKVTRRQGGKGYTMAHRYFDNTGLYNSLVFHSMGGR